MGIELRPSPRALEVTKPLNLEEISQAVENPRIDLSKKWPVSDVSLLAKNALGRVLYTNKEILAGVSPYFHKIFYKNQVSEEIKKSLELADPVIHLDVEYATLKQILSIIHHCNTNYKNDGYTLVHPVLLHDMYLAASVDNLDIPIIMDFCRDNLREQKGVTAFAVAVKLGLSEIKLLKSLSVDDLQDWVLSKDKAVSYLRDGKEVVITTGSQELVLNAEDIRAIHQRLSASF